MNPVDPTSPQPAPGEWPWLPILARDTARTIADLSAWIDDHNRGTSAETQLWSRTSKITEEAGEVVAAIIGATGQNPRKGFTHTLDDVRRELLDVALTALTAWEHLADNNGQCLVALAAHVRHVGDRMNRARS